MVGWLVVVDDYEHLIFDGGCEFGQYDGVGAVVDECEWYFVVETDV